MEKFQKPQKPKEPTQGTPSSEQRVARVQGTSGYELQPIRSTVDGEPEAQTELQPRQPLAEPTHQQTTDRSRRRDRNPFYAPFYWSLLEDVLTEEELSASSRIVAVGSVAVSVDNLLDAIHGREFFPVLTAAEIMHIAESEGAERQGTLLDRYNLERWGILPNIKRNIEAARRKKYQAIRRLIAESTVDYTSLHLPNKDAIMLALSENDMPHIADVTEFLGKIVQLTRPDVVAAEGAQQEMMTTDTLASRNIDSASARRIRERWSGPEVREFAEALGIDEFELYEMPEALLERAINRHKLNADDITQIRHTGATANEKNELPVVVESAVFTGGAVTTVGTFAASMVLTGAFGVHTFNPVVVGLIGVSLAGIGVSMSAALLDRFANQPLTRLTRNFVSRRKSKKYEARLQEQFSTLQEKVAQLQNSGIGNLQLRLMEERVKARTGMGNEHTPRQAQLLKKWIQYFQSHPAEAQRFEEVFQLHSTTDFHGKGVWSIVSDYKQKLQAHKELE